MPDVRRLDPYELPLISDSLLRALRANRGEIGAQMCLGSLVLVSVDQDAGITGLASARLDQNGRLRLDRLYAATRKASYRLLMAVARSYPGCTHVYMEVEKANPHIDAPFFTRATRVHSNHTRIIFKRKINP